MKKILVSMLLAISAIAIIFSLFVLSAIGLGWKIGTVVSGSMEPVLGVGSFAVAKPVDPNTIQQGDIIAFRAPDDPDTIITHRVTSVVHKGDSVSFRTKGDANRSADQFIVPADNLQGKIVFHIPYVGYLISFSRTTWGVAALLAVITATIIFVLRRWLQVQKERTRRQVPEVAIEGEI